MDPKDLVEMLNDLFSRFDSLVEKYRVEKIKTIGDCYMIASGIPSPRADHAKALVSVGLEMLECTNRWTTKFGNKLELRIGINSGPVVAGVIGHKKFAYDLWGDTVNIASRMESHGRPGKIQIAKTSYELIKDEFNTESGGEILVKGKGPMPIWFINGKK
jgi:guanylate cyclase